MSTRLFLYGTLMRGMGNHGLLPRGTFEREARTEPGWRLYASGIPYLVRLDGGEGVLGEIHNVDIETLERLDRLEGHPRWYQRTPLRLEDGVTAEAYVMPLPPEGSRLVLSGSYRQYRADQVW